MPNDIRWIDLATLERTYREVFDGPGSEGQRTLQPEDVSAVTAEQWARARLVPAACLRLLTLRFPVHQYASAVRSQKTATMVPPSRTFLVITRREYVVRRCTVSPEEYKCLSALVEGKNVGEAIEQLADSCDMELEALASNVRTWFCQWARAGYFERIEVGMDRQQ